MQIKISDKIVILEIFDDIGLDKTNFLYVNTPGLVFLKVKHSIEVEKLQPDFEVIDDMLNHADELMYPTKGKEEDFCRRYNALTDAIAHLSFAPLGIDIFGTHYEVVDASGKT
jgi:hypothetical protein